MSRTSRILFAAGGMLSALLCLAGIAPVHAQDSFGSSGQRQAPQPRQQQQYPQQQQPQQQYPQQQYPQQQYPQQQHQQQHQQQQYQQQQYQQQGPQVQQQGGINEAQDLGVAPTQRLRPSDQLGAPTPTSIPGGKVISTRELVQLAQGRPGGMLLLHAYGGPEHLPGAIAVVPAAQGGSFDDQVQQGFAQYLQQATGGDKSRMLVIYCGGPMCWGSYNAALRAIHMGYRNVYWYRGGIEAWRQAGQPVRNAMQGQ